MQCRRVEIRYSLLLQMSVIGHDQRQLQVLGEFSRPSQLSYDDQLLAGQHFV